MAKLEEWKLSKLQWLALGVMSTVGAVGSWLFYAPETFWQKLVATPICLGIGLTLAFLTVAFQDNDL